MEFTRFIAFTYHIDSEWQARVAVHLPPAAGRRSRHLRKYMKLHEGLHLGREAGAVCARGTI